jgi:hypothetical protein
MAVAFGPMLADPLVGDSPGRHRHSTLSLAVIGCHSSDGDVHGNLAVIAVTFRRNDSVAIG